MLLAEDRRLAGGGGGRAEWAEVQERGVARRAGAVPGRESAGALRAARGESVEEAGEVQDVEHGRGGGSIAVGVGVAGGEAVEEAGEVQDVEGGRGGGAVAVCGAGDGQGPGVAEGSAVGAPEEDGFGAGGVVGRSGERRVGKECRSRG